MTISSKTLLCSFKDGNMTFNLLQILPLSIQFNLHYFEANHILIQKIIWFILNKFDGQAGYCQLKLILSQSRFNHFFSFSFIWTKK